MSTCTNDDTKTTIESPTVKTKNKGSTQHYVEPTITTRTMSTRKNDDTTTSIKEPTIESTVVLRKLKRPKLMSNLELPTVANSAIQPHLMENKINLITMSTRKKDDTTTSIKEPPIESTIVLRKLKRPKLMSNLELPTDANSHIQPQLMENKINIITMSTQTNDDTTTSIKEPTATTRTSRRPVLPNPFITASDPTMSTHTNDDKKKTVETPTHQKRNKLPLMLPTVANSRIQPQLMKDNPYRKATAPTLIPPSVSSNRSNMEESKRKRESGKQGNIGKKTTLTKNVVTDIDEALWLDCTQSEWLLIDKSNEVCVNPNPFYVQALLQPNNLWQSPLVQGMINLIKEVETQLVGRVTIVTDTEDAIMCTHPDRKWKLVVETDEVIICIQTPTHYYLAYVNYDSNTINAYDHVTSTVESEKVLKVMDVVKTGIVRQGYESVNLNKTPTVSYRFNAKDCGASVIKTILDLSKVEYDCKNEKYEDNNDSKSMDRRFPVLKYYVNKVYQTLLDGRVSRAGDERKQDCPTSVLMEMVKHSLGAFEDPKRVAVNSGDRNSCFACKSCLIGAETLSAFTLEVTKEEVKAKKEKGVKVIKWKKRLPSFKFCIPTCCFRRFHLDCYKDNDCKCIEQSKVVATYEWCGNENKLKPSFDCSKPAASDVDTLEYNEGDFGDGSLPEASDVDSVVKGVTATVEDGTHGTATVKSNDADIDDCEFDNIIGNISVEAFVGLTMVDSALLNRSELTALRLREFTEVRPEIVAWLNNRTDKAVKIHDESGTMYDVEEILNPSDALLHISGADRLAIVKALDPLRPDLSLYTGVDKHRIRLLRSTGWLDCSVIDRILVIHRCTIPKRMKLKLHSSYWESVDFVKKPIEIGWFHLLICNVSSNHWIALEIDDRALPRPNCLTVFVYGAFKHLDKNEVRWLDKLKVMFGGVQLLYAYDKTEVEDQNGYDCGIVALRRALVRIKYGLDHRITLKDFGYLGGCVDSRLSFVNYILKNNRLPVEVASPSLPPNVVRGMGSNESPFVFLPKPATRKSGMVEGPEMEKKCNTKLAPNNLLERLNYESDRNLPTSLAPLATTTPTQHTTSTPKRTNTTAAVASISSNTRQRSKTTTATPTLNSSSPAPVASSTPTRNTKPSSKRKNMEGTALLTTPNKGQSTKNPTATPTLNTSSPVPVATSTTPPNRTPSARKKSRNTTPTPTMNTSPPASNTRSQKRVNLQGTPLPIIGKGNVAYEMDKLPVVEAGNKVSWICPESLGLQYCTRIKGFYHGNLLFVTKEEDFEHAKSTFSKIFKPPLIEEGDVRFLCKDCNTISPNHHTYMSHLFFCQVNGRCPNIGEITGGDSATPSAFLVLKFVLDFLDHAVAEYIETNLLPMDLLDPHAAYTNYAGEVHRHVCQKVRDEVKQEKAWIAEQRDGYKNNKVDSLFLLIVSKVLLRKKEMQAKQSHTYGPFPICLSMPYIDSLFVYQNYTSGASVFKELGPRMKFLLNVANGRVKGRVKKTKKVLVVHDTPRESGEPIVISHETNENKSPSENIVAVEHYVMTTKGFVVHDPPSGSLVPNPPSESRLVMFHETNENNSSLQYIEEVDQYVTNMAAV